MLILACKWVSNIKFDLDVHVDNRQCLADTSKTKLMLGTFRGKCPEGIKFGSWRTWFKIPVFNCGRGWEDDYPLMSCPVSRKENKDQKVPNLRVVIMLFVHFSVGNQLHRINCHHGHFLSLLPNMLLNTILWFYVL